MSYRRVVICRLCCSPQQFLLLLPPRLPNVQSGPFAAQKATGILQAWSVPDTDQLAICHLGHNASEERSCSYTSVSRSAAQVENQLIAPVPKNPTRVNSTANELTCLVSGFAAMPIIVCGWKTYVLPQRSVVARVMYFKTVDRQEFRRFALWDYSAYRRCSARMCRLTAEAEAVAEFAHPSPTRKVSGGTCQENSMPSSCVASNSPNRTRPCGLWNRHCRFSAPVLRDARRALYVARECEAHLLRYPCHQLHRRNHRNHGARWEV